MWPLYFPSNEEGTYHNKYNRSDCSGWSVWTTRFQARKCNLFIRWNLLRRTLDGQISNTSFCQGYNARKVISDVYASFVLQYTVSVTAWHKIHLSHKNQWNILVIGNYYVNYLGYETNTNASILVYKFNLERTGSNMYAEYTQLQLTFRAL